MKPYQALGVEVHPVTIDDLNRSVAAAIESGRKWVIGCHNLHSVYLYHREQRMRDFYRIADQIHADGMPLVWIGRWRGNPLNASHRVTWMDWLEPLIELAARNDWSVYYIGSQPGVAARAATILRDRYRGLRIETEHGYFDATPGSAANREIVERVNAYNPAILMVGMGQPRQEKWVADHASQLHARVIVTPGACMDYVAGLVSIPPRWMGSAGLEWLYRLHSEPRRMFRRYLVEPWSLMGLLWKDLLGGTFAKGRRG